MWLAGQSLFDAVCHAMATLAAGGFSPHPQSIGGYQNPAVEWIVIVFMFIAGANFALQYRALARRDWRILTGDEELRAYAGIVAVATVLLVIALGVGNGLEAAVRTALFQVLSIITTTGFASTDFNLWSDQAKMVLLVLMFIGGCAGSASGGPKVVRHLLLARYTLQSLRRTLHPRAVLPVKLGGRVVPEAIMQVVVVFFLFYLLVFSVCTGDRGGARRRHRHRHHRDDRLPRQHRSGVQPGRADGPLRRSASGEPGHPHAGDVDRPARSAHRAGRAAARGRGDRASGRPSRVSAAAMRAPGQRRPRALVDRQAELKLCPTHVERLSLSRRGQRRGSAGRAGSSAIGRSWSNASAQMPWNSAAVCARRMRSRNGGGTPSPR